MLAIQEVSLFHLKILNEEQERGTLRMPAKLTIHEMFLIFLQKKMKRLSTV